MTGLTPGDYLLTMNYSDGQSDSRSVTVTSGQTLAVGFAYVQKTAAPKVPEGFVFVQGGTFQMGSNTGDADEKPVHSVTVGSFSLSATEVTQGQFFAVMGTNSSDFEGENRPVVRVSWFDAVAYCNKLSEQEGRTPAYNINGSAVALKPGSTGYRLPTEAEWEFAARGGVKSSGFTYSGSNRVDDVAWYSGNGGSQTQPVGTKKANELGLYDMSGNIWEWVWDWYGNYSTGSQADPQGASSGSGRVFRGGSSSREAADVRSAIRGGSSPADRYYSVGFRVLVQP